MVFSGRVLAHVQAQDQAGSSVSVAAIVRGFSWSHD